MKWGIRLFGLAILAIILWRVDLGAVGARLAMCSPAWAAAALGLNLAAIAIKALRWQLMLRAQGVPCGIPRALRSYCAGIFVGLATPGRLGELSRAADLRRCGGTSVARGLSSVVIDRLMDLYALLAVGLAAVFRFELASELSVVFIVLATLVAASPLVLANPRVGRRLLRGVLGPLFGRRLGRILKDGTEDFFAGVELLLGARLIPGVLLTVAAYGVFFLGALLLAVSIGIEISFEQVALTMGLASLLSIMPITIAGVGTRDAAVVFCFLAMGRSETDALGLSAMVLAVFYVMTALATLPFFLATRFDGRPQDPAVTAE